MTLIELAQKVNSSADPMAKDSIKEEFNNNSNAFYNYCLNNLEEVINASEHDSYHIGRAFFNLLKEKHLPIIIANDDLAINGTAVNISLACAIICLSKALCMRTAQSMIAASLFYTILKDFNSQLIPTIASLTNGYIREYIEDPDSIVSLIPDVPNDFRAFDKRITYVKYYIIFLTNSQPAGFKLNKTNFRIGELYMKALYFESVQQIKRYIEFGMI